MELYRTNYNKKQYKVKPKTINKLIKYNVNVLLLFEFDNYDDNNNNDDVNLCTIQIYLHLAKF